MKQEYIFFWNFLAFSIIQQMLTIWSLAPPPFLKPTCTSESSRFTYCWSLAWRILSIFFLASAMLCLVTQSCLTLCDIMDYSPPDSSRQEYWSGLWCPPPGDLPTQGSNPGLPHCRWILYWLNHQGSPRILEWVAYPFLKGSSQPRNQIRVFCIAGRFFPNWATKEAHMLVR